MGKGLGHIGRAIEAILIAEPDNAFTVEDLCDRVYPGVNRIEKKHRVAMIRAAKSVAKKRGNVETMRGAHLGGTLIFHTADNANSWGMTWLKKDYFDHQYRNNDQRVSTSRVQTENELRERLIEGGQDHSRVGGEHAFEVELWKAKQVGDLTKVAKMEAKQARDSSRRIAKLVKGFAKIGFRTK